MTWREVVYDIYHSLKQNFDDSELTLNHVIYWVSVTANRLLAQHIDKRDSGAFLTVFDNVQVLIDPVTHRQYIELPAAIFDYDDDGGIEYISYSYCVDECKPPFTSVTFAHTTQSTSQVLYYSTEEKPSPAMPYWYRVGDRIYFLGTECINICGIEIGLYLSLSPDTVCDLDEPFPFPDELIVIMQRHVLDLGRFVLMMPTDRVNEGTTSLELNDMPKSKIISVNQLTEPTQQQMVQQQQMAQQQTQ